MSILNQVTKENLEDSYGSGSVDQGMTQGLKNPHG